MKSIRHSLLLVVFLVVLANMCSGVGEVNAQEASEAIVHGVLFFSPNCPHCAKVITQDLPPLKQTYGDQLLILEIDITQTQGLQLYQTAIEAMNIPSNRLGVPTLILDEHVLVGSVEIPNLLPGLIDQYLAQGGLDWPAIPGLTEYLAQVTSMVTPVASVTPTAEPSALPQPTVLPTQPLPTPTATDLPPYLLSYESGQHMLTNFTADQPANSIALLVLAGMMVSVVVMPCAVTRPLVISRSEWIAWAIPLLSIAGIAVAGYLTYVEMSETQAVCWPIGQCNEVQQSAYARVGGLIPVGLLGLVGYCGILLAWLVSRLRIRKIASLAAAVLLGMAFFGTLFSMVLTFLEPFIIGATCLWCLASAVLITCIFILSVPYYWSVQGRGK